MWEALEFFSGFWDMFCVKSQSIESETTDGEGEYHSEQIKPMKFSYRPQTLEQYIGQERAKELVKLNIQKIQTIKPVHFIISGSKGTGKSTLAYIIANHLDFKIHTYIGGTFTMENLRQFLIENEEGKPHILFIDEIHSLGEAKDSKGIGEFMYPILEDRKLPGSDIELRPFIFMGCTTDLNILQTRYAPLIDRCQGNVKLEHYNWEDIKLILKQYNEKIYKENISEEVYELLAKNTRYTPRIALAYFDDYIVLKDIKKVLNAHRVIKNSLTIDDIVILKHLAEIDKPVGVEVLSIITQQTKKDYQLLQEPFLLMDGYISRLSKGRIITNKGKQLLEELK